MSWIVRKGRAKLIILSSISSGRSVAKSFDWCKWVMGVARCGCSTGDDSAVKRAYQSVHDSELNLNSGGEHHKNGAYCCVLVESQSRQNNPSKSKAVYMVSCVFQRFGDGKCSTPSSWHGLCQEQPIESQWISLGWWSMMTLMTLIAFATQEQSFPPEKCQCLMHCSPEAFPGRVRVWIGWSSCH